MRTRRLALRTRVITLLYSRFTHRTVHLILQRSRTFFGEPIRIPK